MAGTTYDVDMGGKPVSADLLPDDGSSGFAIISVDILHGKLQGLLCPSPPVCRFLRHIRNITERLPDICRFGCSGYQLAFLEGM